MRVRPTVIGRSPPLPEYPQRDFSSYKIVKLVGKGTYGKVFKAKDLRSAGEFVAMKFVRMEKESEGFPISGLREIKVLRELDHPNVVQLREIVHQDDDKGRGTYLVFEYINHDLSALLSYKALDEGSIYRIFKQLLDALDYCHKRNIIHRDLKCSNILVSREGKVKLADFGLGRKWIPDRPFTNQVISLWYRPIELLLGEENYGTSVDLWSLGCIFGELFQRGAVFPYESEKEMISGIYDLCGTPTKRSWPEAKHLPGYKAFRPKYHSRTLTERFSFMPPLALELFDKMLCLNPKNRITTAEARKSPWILTMGCRRIIEPLKLPRELDYHELDVRLRSLKHSEQ